MWARKTTGTAILRSIRGRAYPLVAAGQARGQEPIDHGADLLDVGFEREMPGVEKVHLGIGNVAPERFRAGRQKERVVRSPHCEQRRPRRAEVSLERRVERDVAGVVAEQIELDL